MKYSEFIEANKDFQSSVNLEFDLNKTEKIKAYIPTEQSVKILGELLRSFYSGRDPQERATVLSGPYGRGKSHLFLILSALTSYDVFLCGEEKRTETSAVLEELCRKIGNVSAETGALAREIVDGHIRTLPVIVNSNTTDIGQAFLLALYHALNRADLERFFPETYFDAAADMIEKWEKEYPEAIQKLNKGLAAEKTTVDELKIGLRSCRQEDYELFCRQYTDIAAGSVFNPMTNTDVVKLYKSVAIALKEQNTPYCGISIVFDEFSKFLEANLDKSRMQNFKIIQDMAEAAVRSGDAQIHFTCITHKDIVDYSSSDSFKTVEGRFRKLRFISSSEQSYELIANAIIRRDGYRQYVVENLDEFRRIAAVSSIPTVFEDLSPEAYWDKLVEGCFPLAPLSAYSLLHISELVGQNERTLFTFLSQPGEHSFRSFLDEERKSIEWITIDRVYDYFEEIFRKEIFNSTVHGIWSRTDSALKKVSDPEQRRILKAMAVINIIGDDRLRTVPLHLCAVLLSDEKVLLDNIRQMCRENVVSQRESLEVFLLTPEGVDIQEKIRDYIKENRDRFNVRETLTEACDQGFVIPRGYNDRYTMTRCFRCIYMEPESFFAYENAAEMLADYPYDGLLVNIVGAGSDIAERVQAKLADFEPDAPVVVCVTSSPDNNNVFLMNYVSVREIEKKNKDPRYSEELKILLEDYGKRAQRVSERMYAPSSPHSIFYTKNGKVEIRRQAELNQCVSDLCEGFYCHTPKINNEMVNKCTITPQIVKARNIVVDWIFAHSDDNTIPCMEGAGPEVSIYKSAFVQTGLDQCEKPVNDKGMEQVLDLIRRFVLSAENGKAGFGKLYSSLTSSPFGMRKGIIPLYIAYVLRSYKENAVIYFKGREVELSSALLSSLNEAPDEYELLIENGTAEIEQYFDGLQELFADHADSGIRGINRVYTIVKSMQKWIRALAEYTKKHTICLRDGESVKIDPSVAAFRAELLKFEINSRDLLVNVFPKIFCAVDLQECFEKIKLAKETLDGHLSLCSDELKIKLTEVFVSGYCGSLSAAVKLWYGQLPVETRNHVFDAAGPNNLLGIAAEVSSYDDDILLAKMITTFVSLSLEDWNDNLIEAFLKSVQSACEKINGYKADDTQQESRLSLTINGQKIARSFSAGAVSPLGKTAYNGMEAVLEEYGEALAPDEWLSILAQLIGKIVH